MNAMINLHEPHLGEIDRGQNGLAPQVLQAVLHCRRASRARGVARAGRGMRNLAAMMTRRNSMAMSS
jgi:hypothetical protein